jgi:transposase-like protein
MQDTPAGRRVARADGPRSSRPRRRTFTAAYKLAMIEKYDAATEPGAKGALLRGEGLYDSHISYWRKARESGALKSPSAAVPAVAHQGRLSGDAENERLRKRTSRPSRTACTLTFTPAAGRRYRSRPAGSGSTPRRGD